VEEAWDRAAESRANLPFGESPLSPQLYFPGSTQACISPVPAIVIPSPGEHSPERPRRGFLVDHPCFTIPTEPSSVASVDEAEWPDDLLSALVAHEPPESVNPITGTSTPD